MLVRTNLSCSRPVRRMNRNCYITLHIRSGPPYPEPPGSPQIAVDGRFGLSSDIWIEKLETEFAKRNSEGLRTREPQNG